MKQTKKEMTEREEMMAERDMSIEYAKDHPRAAEREKAAMKIQARMRGKKARQEIDVKKNERMAKLEAIRAKKMAATNLTEDRANDDAAAPDATTAEAPPEPVVTGPEPPPEQNGRRFPRPSAPRWDQLVPDTPLRRHAVPLPKRSAAPPATVIESEEDLERARPRFDGPHGDYWRAWDRFEAGSWRLGQKCVLQISKGARAPLTSGGRSSNPDASCRLQYKSLIPGAARRWHSRGRRALSGAGVGLETLD